MKALRVLGNIRSLFSEAVSCHRIQLPSQRFYSAQSDPDSNACFSTDNTEDSSIFDSSHYSLPELSSLSTQNVSVHPTWDPKYRLMADKLLSGKDGRNLETRILVDDEKTHRAAVLARALLEAAVDEHDDDDVDGVTVKEEDQKSLSVGIVGAPNAGKSCLTNYIVGTKVAAVSRKTNTTTHEVLGLLTRGNTQICFFDTPGLMLKKSGYPHSDMRVRVESAWNSINLYDVLIIIFDVHRHLSRPDSRVVRLIERIGADSQGKQKRILCMNKVDLVEKKKDLLNIIEEFKNFVGYERQFMISGLKGYGVNDLIEYLMEQAVRKPWDEDPFAMSEEVLKNVSLEVVREKLLHHVHQEIPYAIEQRLMCWEELEDGSLRIVQHLITHKQSQKKILVGKRGCKIGRIGIEANQDLRSILNREVHLVLKVKLNIKSPA